MDALQPPTRQKDSCNRKGGMKLYIYIHSFTKPALEGGQHLHNLLMHLHKEGFSQQNRWTENGKKKSHCFG